MPDEKLKPNFYIDSVKYSPTEPSMYKVCKRCSNTGVIVRNDGGTGSTSFICPCSL